MKRLSPFLIFLLLLPSAAAALNVVTSVPPLQLVVAGIIGEQGQVETLIDARQSPHHFQLKPSQMRKLARADAVIWIDNHFETGLARLHQQLPENTLRLQLSQFLPASMLIGQGHDIDGHLWLSPSILSHLAPSIAENLARLDPANAALYQRNAHNLKQRIDAWLSATRQDFNSIKPRYILDHGFLAYLERDLGLHNGGSLRNNHDHGGSMRHLSHLHESLDTHHARCLLVDRLPASAQAQQVAKAHGLNIKEIRVLGDPQTMNSIIDILAHITDVLRDCQ